MSENTTQFDPEIAIAMKKMSPVEVRKVMTLIKAYTSAGIWFYPVPAISPDDFLRLQNEANEKLAIMLDHCENN